MQAGEKLNFILPPHELAQHTSTEHERGARYIIESFIGLCRGLLDRFPDAVKSGAVEDDIADLQAFELPLCIQANDGSYLHILIFGHSIPDGTLDFGINITEHDEDGVLKEGHLYTYDYDGFMRQHILPIGTINDEPDRSHFSLLNEIRAEKVLTKQEQSDDMELRMQAMEVRQYLEEAAQFDAWDIAMGFDGVMPSQAEVFSLAELLDLAEPYTPPHESIEFFDE